MMHWVDWLIVIVPVLFVIGLALYSKRYARGVVDFLAAGRVAGRYVMTIGEMSICLSVVVVVATSEQIYQTGVGVAFWNTILLPVTLVLALTGFCTYRWRETRCLSKGQFIELRYGSRSFRIVTAVISTVSEMVTNAIGPAIAANFFIYYLGLPHRIMIFGISLPCYGIIVGMCLAMAIVMIWPAGRISLMITDCVQGLLSYPIFVVISGYVLLKLSWDVDVFPVLWNRVPEESFISPYDVARLRDFNIFAIVVTVTSTVLNRASWIGMDISSSGRTPHEQKMAGVLGSFRSGFAFTMITLLAIVVIAFMNGGHFASRGADNPFEITNVEVRRELTGRVIEETVDDPVLSAKISEKVAAIHDPALLKNEIPPLSQEKNLDTPYFNAVRSELGDSPEARLRFQEYRTLYFQQMMPVVMSKIFPVGIFGLFCLLMIMLLVSTDASRIFNAAGCLVQDMILPFFRGHLAPEKHLLILRLTSVGVTVFFFIVSLFFAQLDYINMFMTIMCALWLGGAGPIMLGGLYTRFGNLTGAWCAIIFGSGTSLLGLIAQRNWARLIYPWLDQAGLVDPLNRFLLAVSSPFEPWIHWEMDAVKFPINSFEIFFISMALSISGYVIGSWVTYKPFDLDKLLHRDPNAPKAKADWSMQAVFGRILGITAEYTRCDRIITYALFLYSFGYQFIAIFVAVIVWNFFQPWPQAWWNSYFYINSLVIPIFVGVISTVWFLIGGVKDTIQLFADLARRKENPLDNGQVGRGDETVTME